jgi:hypothetical protein
VIPAIQQCLARVDELDGELQAQRSAEIEQAMA